MLKITAPLKWEESGNETYQSFTANTPFGNFYVERNRQDWNAALPWEKWFSRYCFAEYYDEFSRECKTAVEGKRMAQEEWDKRILKCVKIKA